MLFANFNQKSPNIPIYVWDLVLIYKQSVAFYENPIKHCFHLLFLLIFTHKKNTS
jgi:hypothetical protein